MKQFHVLPAGLRNRNLQADPSERPNTLSKWGLSRCQPISTPMSYSVQRPCWIRVGGPPNVSTSAMISAGQEGIGSHPATAARHSRIGTRTTLLVACP